MTRFLLLRLAARACFLLSLPCLLFAQAPAGVLAGQVRDPSGLPVPDAHVTVRAPERNFARSARTDQGGAFRIPALEPGRYEVDVERAGFARYELRHVELATRQTVELDITLRLGARAEAVRVEAEATPLDAAPGSVGFVIGPASVLQLPLVVRNFVGLVALGPGVVQRHLGGFTHDVNNDAQPARGAVGLNHPVNGSRSTTNQFLLDGVLNTDGNTNALVLSPPLESIQEFRLQTSVSPAEFGFASGGVVNVVTRGGTQKLHGGLFEFLRNEKLDAHGFFDPAGQPKPPFRQNQFGGQAGGPLPRLRDGFFFAAYEGLRSRLGHSVRSAVPDAALRRGDFSGRDPVHDPRTGLPFPNNILPPERVDPIARQFLEKFEPLPSGPGTNYTDSTPDRRTTDSASGRLDKAWAGRGNLFGRYSLNEDRARLAGFFPVLPASENIRAQHLALGYTYAGRTFVNDLRAGLSRLRILELPESAFRHDVVGELGITGIDRDPINYGLPVFILGSFQMVTDDPTLPQAQHDLTYHLLEQFTWRRGRHNWSWGGELRRFQMNFLQRLNSRGRYNFSGAFSGDDFADFLLGLPQSTERSAGSPQAYLRRLAYALYLQDEVSLRPGLRLSAGLRYESSSPLTEIRNNLFNLDYSTLPAAPALVRAGGKLGRALVEPDRNNFAPRLGLAWRPGSRGLGSRLLFRGGYGIFFSPEIAVETYDLVRNGTRNEKNTVPADRPLLTLRDGFPAGASTGFPSFFGLDPNARTPYVQQWNGGWQADLKGFLLEATYVGTKGTRLGRFRAFNTPAQAELGRNLPPRPGDIQELRPFPNLGKLIQRQHISNSVYHALELRAERRMSRSLVFQGSFTWAKSIDDADSVIPGLFDSFGAQDERNLRPERGLSFFDVRARFTFHFVYDLPLGPGRRWANAGWAAKALGGWQLSGIVLEQGGTPLNPVFFFTDLANSDTPNRPNVVAGQKISLPRDQRTPERFFNTDAFSTPAPFTFGNAGRDIIPGPGNNLFDLAVHRRFGLGESGNLEFRAEFFNSFNHPNFGIPGPYPDFGPFFGKIFTVGDPRRIQMALKWSF